MSVVHEDYDGRLAVEILLQLLFIILQVGNSTKVLCASGAGANPDLVARFVEYHDVSPRAFHARQYNKDACGSGTLGTPTDKPRRLQTNNARECRSMTMDAKTVN